MLVHDLEARELGLKISSTRNWDQICPSESLNSPSTLYPSIDEKNVKKNLTKNSSCTKHERANMNT